MTETRGEFRAKMRAWAAEEPLKKERAVEFFSKLDLSKIEDSLNEVQKEASEVQDVTYRIYHHSFKMYYFRLQTFILFSKVLGALGETFPEIKEKNEDEVFSSIVARLEYWFLDEEIITLLKELVATKFSLKDQQERWPVDTKTLTSAYFISREVVLATLMSMKNIKDKKEGFLWKMGWLSTEDALVLEVWNCLGLAFRYTGREGSTEYADKCRAIINCK